MGNAGAGEPARVKVLRELPALTAVEVKLYMVHGVNFPSRRTTMIEPSSPGDTIAAAWPVADLSACNPTRSAAFHDPGPDASRGDVV
jgi:hypothetical protein